MILLHHYIAHSTVSAGSPEPEVLQDVQHVPTKRSAFTSKYFTCLMLMPSSSFMHVSPTITLPSSTPLHHHTTIIHPPPPSSYHHCTPSTLTPPLLSLLYNRPLHVVYGRCRDMAAVALPNIRSDIIISPNQNYITYI